ncbi:MAG TPA: PQQ-binding-like beta-propeller repeat protein [Actinomycetota bacterium]|nr:PQQ-binding-like beta-propeller repeat protein [Actinomycetota bacterium]
MRITMRLLLAVLMTAASLQVAGPAAAVEGCAGPASGGDWFTRGGDLSGRRFQPAETTIGVKEAATLEPAWTFPIGGVSATPVVADGCVYFVAGGNVVKLNADSGELLWNVPAQAGASVTYDAGRVFANVNIPGGVGMVAIDADSGDIAWSTPVDDQYHVTVTGSPVAWNGMVITGFAAGLQELESGPQRTIMRGGYAILDQQTGAVIHKAHTIPDDDFAHGYAGGGLWSTPAVDPETGHAYFGTGNPYSAREHPHTNAIIKIDVDRQRSTFGKIVGSYKGIPDLYLANVTYKPACEQTHLMPHCEPLDIDFGGSANLWKDSRGRTIVGDLQKAGVYHAVNTADMNGVWMATISYPAMFGNSGTAAVDDKGVYATVSYGAMWGLDSQNGAVKWATPGGNGWASVNSVANGVVYEADTGVFRAVDRETGIPVLTRPLAQDTGRPSTTGLDAGVAIARNTIYVNASDALIAYRPA